MFSICKWNVITEIHQRLYDSTASKWWKVCPICRIKIIFIQCLLHWTTWSISGVYKAILLILVFFYCTTFAVFVVPVCFPATILDKRVGTISNFPPPPTQCWSIEIKLQNSWTLQQNNSLSDTNIEWGEYHIWNISFSEGLQACGHVWWRSVASSRGWHIFLADILFLCVCCFLKKCLSSD